MSDHGSLSGSSGDPRGDLERGLNDENDNGMEVVDSAVYKEQNWLLSHFEGCQKYNLK
jgi:hypothetical protein